MSFEQQSDCRLQHRMLAGGCKGAEKQSEKLSKASKASDLPNLPPTDVRRHLVFFVAATCRQLAASVAHEIRGYG